MFLKTLVKEESKMTLLMDNSQTGPCRKKVKNEILTFTDSFVFLTWLPLNF